MKSLSIFGTTYYPKPNNNHIRHTLVRFSYNEISTNMDSYIMDIYKRHIRHTLVGFLYNDISTNIELFVMLDIQVMNTMLKCNKIILPSIICIP